MNEVVLRTVYEPEFSGWNISHDWKVVTMGSCFAEVMGRQLSEFKFDVLTNPFGTLFNPFSIAKLLKLALFNELPAMRHFINPEEGVWLHHDLHSSIWGRTSGEIDSRIRTLGNEVRKVLAQTNLLVLTFGTAYVHRLKASGEIIANCHKVSGSAFTKEMMSVEAVNACIKEVIGYIKILNPSVKVLLTVSPVRHTKETLPGNQLSKSILRVACSQLVTELPGVAYFPAYEIMIDDLRDYRFYDADLIHPNGWAEDHIFSVFGKSYFAHETLKTLESWKQVKKMINHKPLHDNTESHRQMLLSLKEKLMKLEGKIEVSEELSEVDNLINNFPRLSQTQ